MSDWVEATFDNCSIFTDQHSKTKTLFNFIPLDFIQGLKVGEHTLNCIRITCRISFNINEHSVYITTDKVDLKLHQTNKRYLTKIHNSTYGSNTILVAFDSLEFLAGLMSYLSWLCGNGFVIETFQQDLSCNLNIKYLLCLPILYNRDKIEEIIELVLLKDIAQIIWSYLVIKCNGTYGNMKCITLFDSDIPLQEKCPGCSRSKTNINPFICEITRC